MIRLFLLLLTASLCLIACGSVPPAPVDRFYRLQSVSVSTPAGQLPGGVTVRSFRGESLYAERPIIFADASSLRQLRQYHYHLWLYPPARLVEAHLVASLGQAGSFSGGTGSANVLEGNVVGFERVVDGRSSKAVVALDLKLTVGERVVIGRIYRAEQEVVGDSIDSFAMAMEQALGRIYADFMSDAVKYR